MAKASLQMAVKVGFEGTYDSLKKQKQNTENNLSQSWRHRSVCSVQETASGFLWLGTFCKMKLKKLCGAMVSIYYVFCLASTPLLLETAHWFFFRKNYPCPFFSSCNWKLIGQCYEHHPKEFKSYILSILFTRTRNHKNLFKWKIVKYFSKIFSNTKFSNTRVKKQNKKNTHDESLKSQTSCVFTSAYFSMPKQHGQKAWTNKMPLSHLVID